MVGPKIQKYINVARLRQSSMCQHLVDTFSNVSFDGSCEKFKEQFYSTGVDILWLNEWKYRDWFDENYFTVNQLLETKYSLHNSFLDSSLTN